MTAAPDIHSGVAPRWGTHLTSDISSRKIWFWGDPRWRPWRDRWASFSSCICFTNFANFRLCQWTTTVLEQVKATHRSMYKLKWLACSCHSVSFSLLFPDCEPPSADATPGQASQKCGHIIHVGQTIHNWSLQCIPLGASGHLLQVILPVISVI